MDVVVCVLVVACWWLVMGCCVFDVGRWMSVVRCQLLFDMSFIWCLLSNRLPPHCACRTLFVVVCLLVGVCSVLFVFCCLLFGR